MRCTPRMCCWALGWLLAIAGCAGGELNDWGCRSDEDCKGDRVCVAGVCQDPDGVCLADDDCPAGYACRAGNCELCDADGDGEPRESCGGQDCDDTNGGVRPGLPELCGDGLDNDCDGQIDPAGLCGELCAGVKCAEGLACDPDTGLCVPICTPDCAGRDCGPDGCDGSCGQCSAGEQCDREGLCQAGCQDRCPAGQTACAANSVVRCADFDNDGCTEWGDSQPCPIEQTCADGRCQDLCRDECAEGTARCFDTSSHQLCARNNDPDECTEWGQPLPCPAGTTCDFFSGQCQQSCRDECDPQAALCLDAFTMQQCGQYDTDPCLEWSPPQPCPPDAKCDPMIGRCLGDCTDECAWDEARCLDEGTSQTCGQWDSDPCLDWSPPERCPASAPCDRWTGRCGGCSDECAWGESQCAGQASYQECSDWDGDGCTEFGPEQPCPANTACDWSTGRCAGGCADDCRWGDFQCLSERRWRACGEYDGDPCLDWSPVERCQQGMVCSVGARGCVAGCQDDCQEGQSMCLDPIRVQECGWFDDDPCLDWSPPMFCPDGSLCDPAVGGCNGCWPLSCWELGVECGRWEDGCGGVLDCGWCPDDMVCDPDVGRCLPNGGFGSICFEGDGCASGLYCLMLDANRPGYCSSLCSSVIGCPNGFACLIDLGDAGRWCAAACSSSGGCGWLGSWSCQSTDWGPLCLPG